MTRGQKVAVALVGLVLAGLVAGVGGIFGVFWYYGRDIADLDETRLRNYRPPQVTRIYAAGGELIGEIYTQRRTFIAYEDIPAHVENAFLAAEDADFYKHEGMDYFGMARALLVNVRAGELRQGASTITQQVIKTFVLSPERTLRRKVQELILARRLEQAFTKHEILELYLNEIYLGHGRYGIEEASRYYFGKSVRDIDIGQAALLATMPKAPSRDSPFKNPERARTRQHWVLEQMVAHDFIKRADADLYIGRELDVVRDRSDAPAVVPGAEEFVDEVERELRARFGDRLDSLGARVQTTVDLEAQKSARSGLLSSMAELDERRAYGRYAIAAKPKVLKAVRNEWELWRKRKAPMGDVLRAVVLATPAVADWPADTIAVDVDGHALAVTVPDDPRFRDPSRPLAEVYVPGAVTPVAVRELGDGEGRPAGYGLGQIVVPEAAVIVTDVETGEVRAMVGGRNYERGSYNRVLRAKRHPGSAFKPFVYGAALASRRFTAATLVSDSPEVYERWKPTNFEGDVYRGDIRVREAMTKSVNTVAIKILHDIGVPAAHEFARAAGITSELPDNLSLALGTAEIPPWEMARAYLTLARGGSRIPLTLIRSIEVPREPREEHTLEPEQVLDADTVYVLTSLMRSVVKEGTGAKAAALGRPVAGKTGTSAEYHDAWFAGFTRAHVAVAWVGFDRPRPLGAGETGGKAAIPVWLSAMRAVEHGPAEDFLPPPTVTVRRIDAATGLLAPTEGADPEAKVLEEVFVAGTEPIEEATPAAKADDDVLLGLYGESPDAPESPPEDPNPDPAPEPPDVPPAIVEPDPSPRAKPTGGLPSITDVP